MARDCYILCLPFSRDWTRLYSSPYCSGLPPHPRSRCVKGAPRRLLARQHEVREVARRRVQVHPDDVDVREVREHEDEQEQDEHRVLLDLVVGAQRVVA